MSDQGQLWNAGPVKKYRGNWNQKLSDQRKVADGRNKERMLRRTAAKHGMSVAQYQEHKAEAARKRAERLAPREPITKTCTICEQPFQTTRTKQVLCGAAQCRRKYQSQAVSAAIKRRYRTDPEFRDKVISNEQARRASKLGLGNRKITIAYLLERDNWRCGICGKKIRKREDASLDHIVPLGKDGTHTLENVQAAHRRCNYAKGDRGGGEQLLIVG